MKKLSLAAFLCLAVSACATDVANRYYGKETYAAKQVEEVEVLTTKPKRDFFVIADFQSRGETAKDLQKKAAAIGADAVIVGFLGGLYNNSDQWAGADSMSNSYSRVIGTAIRYKDNDN